MSRKNQEQMWLDTEFKDRLEKLQAKKRLAGKKISLRELTNQMVKSKSWEQLENEILESDRSISKDIVRMNIKFDGNWLK